MIKTPQVLVIDQNGENTGVMTTAKALALAEEAELDLVEISPHTTPPVTKIVDYGRYKYELQKRRNEAKKNQKVIEVKEVQLRPGTEEHDFEVKLRNARRFLSSGNKVKISVRFRGREVAHKEIGQKTLQRFIESLDDCGKVDGNTEMNNRSLQTIISPKA